MNKIALFAGMASLLFSCGRELKTCTEDNGLPPAAPGTFDAALAEKLGADEYGMKPYVMAFLKAGPNRNLDSTESANLQAAHMANINRMAEEGKLAIAGPFMDDGAIRGIYIFNVASVEEAEALTKTDPAIKAGSLVMELHPWYGSAALSEIPERHKLAAKKSF